MDARDISNRFAYHAPKDKETADKHAAIRGECMSLAFTIDALVPDSREKSLAITHLEEVMYWANAAIARAPENQQQPQAKL